MINRDPGRVDQKSKMELFCWMLTICCKLPFSYLIIIKKGCSQKNLRINSISVLQPPRHMCRPGRKLRWQKHNLNLVNYNFSNLISASILIQNSFYAWKEIFWCIFENHLASPNFPPPRTFWRKIDAQRVQAKTFPSKWGYLRTAVIFFFGLRWGKNIKLKCWF